MSLQASGEQAALPGAVDGPHVDAATFSSLKGCRETPSYDVEAQPVLTL